MIFFLKGKGASPKWNPKAWNRLLIWRSFLFMNDIEFILQYVLDQFVNGKSRETNARLEYNILKSSTSSRLSLTGILATHPTRTCLDSLYTKKNCFSNLSNCALFSDQRCQPCTVFGKQITRSRSIRSHFDQFFFIRFNYCFFFSWVAISCWLIVCKNRSQKVRKHCCVIYAGVV